MLFPNVAFTVTQHNVVYTASGFLRAFVPYCNLTARWEELNDALLVKCSSVCTKYVLTFFYKVFFLQFNTEISVTSIYLGSK